MVSLKCLKHTRAVGFRLESRFIWNSQFSPFWNRLVISFFVIRDFREFPLFSQDLFLTGSPLSGSFIFVPICDFCDRFTQLFRKIRLFSIIGVRIFLEIIQQKFFIVIGEKRALRLCSWRVIFNEFGFHFFIFVLWVSFFVFIVRHGLSGARTFRARCEFWTPARPTWDQFVFFSRKHQMCIDN